MKVRATSRQLRFCMTNKAFFLEVVRIRSVFMGTFALEEGALQSVWEPASLLCSFTGVRVNCRDNIMFDYECQILVNLNKSLTRTSNKNKICWVSYNSFIRIQESNYVYQISMQLSRRALWASWARSLLAVGLRGCPCLPVSRVAPALFILHTRSTFMFHALIYAAVPFPCSWVCKFLGIFLPSPEMLLRPLRACPDSLK